MAELDPLRIQDAMGHLSAAQPEVFGASAHRFLLNTPLSENEVCAFERLHNISLPSDYRNFLIRIGNGGAGPYYGVFPLGQLDGTGSSGQEAWHENDGFIGILSEPFLLQDAWNDLSGMPPEELLQSNKEEYSRQLDAFEKMYWADSSRMNGAIPICHMGCALRIWLVVTGDESGHLWRDGRADYTGIAPLTSQDGLRTAFSSWYHEWLQDVLRMLR